MIGKTLKTAFISAAIILAASACGGSSSSAPSPMPPPGGGTGGGGSSGGTGNPVLLSDVEYAKGQTSAGEIPLLLDIYQPSDVCDANRPTVFFVHGGGFTGGDKGGTIAARRAEAVNNKNLSFISINYRLAGDNPVLSAEYQVIADEFIAVAQGQVDNDIIVAAVAAMEDSITALNWLETNADNYCLDMSRLAYWGGSAGALTVLSVAYSANTYNLARPDPDVVINYWGDLVRDMDLEFMEAPFLTLHGDNDQTVDYQSALDLAAQADAIGVPYAFYTHVGGGHGVNTELTVNGTKLIDLTANFIEAHIVGGTPLYETANVD